MDEWNPHKKTSKRMPDMATPESVCKCDVRAVCFRLCSESVFEAVGQDRIRCRK